MGIHKTHLFALAIIIGLTVPLTQETQAKGRFTPNVGSYSLSPAGTSTCDMDGTPTTFTAVNIVPDGNPKDVSNVILQFDIAELDNFDFNATSAYNLGFSEIDVSTTPWKKSNLPMPGYFGVKGDLAYDTQSTVFVVGFSGAGTIEMGGAEYKAGRHYTSFDQSVGLDANFNVSLSAGEVTDRDDAGNPVRTSSFVNVTNDDRSSSVTTSMVYIQSEGPVTVLNGDNNDITYARIDGNTVSVTVTADDNGNYPAIAIEGDYHASVTATAFGVNAVDADLCNNFSSGTFQAQPVPVEINLNSASTVEIAAFDDLTISYTVNNATFTQQTVNVSYTATSTAEFNFNGNVITANGITVDANNCTNTRVEDGGEVTYTINCEVNLDAGSNTISITYNEVSGGRTGAIAIIAGTIEISGQTISTADDVTVTITAESIDLTFDLAADQPNLIRVANGGTVIVNYTANNDTAAQQQTNIVHQAATTEGINFTNFDIIVTDAAGNSTSVFNPNCDITTVFTGGGDRLPSILNYTVSCDMDLDVGESNIEISYDIITTPSLGGASVALSTGMADLAGNVIEAPPITVNIFTLNDCPFGCDTRDN